MDDQQLIDEFDEDERGLIQEILAGPESDEARLVYADWLEEHGDTRGGFLRAELSFAGASSLEDASDGIAFFNSTSFLSLPERWVKLVAMKFDLSLQGFRGREHSVYHWLVGMPQAKRPQLLHGAVYSGNPQLDHLGANQGHWPIPDPLLVPLESDLITAFLAYQKARKLLFYQGYYRDYQPNPMMELSIVRSTRGRSGSDQTPTS